MYWLFYCWQQMPVDEDILRFTTANCLLKQLIHKWGSQIKSIKHIKILINRISNQHWLLQTNYIKLRFIFTLNQTCFRFISWKISAWIFMILIKCRQANLFYRYNIWTKQFIPMVEKKFSVSLIEKTILYLIWWWQNG